MIYHNTAGDCLRQPLVDTLPTRCQQLKKGYGDCKRGMIDMRKRFRGNKPVATSVELEAGGSGQLYAGIGQKKTSSQQTVESDFGKVDPSERRAS
jgi:cytochrome c oxidase assembly factor 5